MSDATEAQTTGGDATAQADPALLDKAFELGGDADFSEATMEALYGATVQDFREGEVVRGTVMEVGSDRILVDIGYKSEGRISTDEFPNPSEISVGDVFDVYIDAPEDEEGLPVLSKYKADRIKNWAHIQSIYEEDGAIKGRIVRRFVSLMILTSIVSPMYRPTRPAGRRKSLRSTLPPSIRRATLSLKEIFSSMPLTTI